MRPEFPSSQENEQEIVELVKSVADTFHSVAVGPTHTPALYAIFLRALISARTDPEAQHQYQHQHHETVDQSHVQAAQPRLSDSSELANGLGTATSANNVGSENVSAGAGAGVNGEPTFAMPEFQFTGEMGAVVDLSVFPPTMASRNPGAGDLGALSMDHILSGGFWDNMLVPGTPFDQSLYNYFSLLRFHSSAYCVLQPSHSAHSASYLPQLLLIRTFSILGSHFLPIFVYLLKFSLILILFYGGIR